MSNPNTPVTASDIIPPPVLNLPWGEIRDGLVYLNVNSFEFLQTLWASISGQTGVIDTNVISTTQSGEITAKFLALMSSVGDARRFMAPPQNLAPVRKHADDAAILARRPHSGIRQSVDDASMFARRPRNPVRQPDPAALTFATLPVNPLDGQRAFIVDGDIPALMNFGASVSGGGANHVPVYYDAGTPTWRIG